MKPRVLGIIPARAGSKGMPWKNLKKIRGKSLLYYTIREAAKSRRLDKVIVSTDSQRIAREAIRYGAEVPFLRSKSLATDISPVKDTVIHALDFLKTRKGEEYEVIVLLQPTSPLRKARHIDMAVDKLLRTDCDTVISVSPVREHPVGMMELDKDKIKKFILKGRRGMRRQDLPPLYKVDGSVYALRTAAFRKTGKFVTKNTRVIMLDWSESMDIDDLIDLEIAKIMMKA